MTLTGNIRKYWTLRKTGKQEPSRSQSTQKRMSIISMEYPSSYQIFGNQYYEKTKQRKQPPKLQHHQTESAKVRNRVWFRTGPNSKSTNQERPQNISILCKHIIPDTHNLRLPTYISIKLLHDSSGLPYVKDRLFSRANKTLERISANPLVEESISSTTVNPAWDRFPTSLSIIRPVSL